VGSPFSGPRHRSWASDTVIFGVVFVITVAITAVSDFLNGPAEAPAYLVGLCGAAGSALFGAASSDKSKREKEVSATAERAESKADDALGRSDASMDAGLTRILRVQERELAANRAALQLMREAVDVKQASGVPVLHETFQAISQLQAQTDKLAEDIIRRRLQLDTEVQARSSYSATTRDTASRAESKADKALKQSAESLEREGEWSKHKNHRNDPRVEGEQ
jgi:hypothetical protein